MTAWASSLANLPVGAVSDILSGLGVPVPGVPATMSTEDFVTTLNTTVDTLQDQVGGTITTTVGTVADPVLGGLGLPVPDTGATVRPDQFGDQRRAGPDRRRAR